MEAFGQPASSSRLSCPIPDRHLSQFACFWVFSCPEYLLLSNSLLNSFTRGRFWAASFFSALKLSNALLTDMSKKKRLTAHLSGQPLMNNTLEPHSQNRLYEAFFLLIYGFSPYTCLQSATANISADSPEFHSQGSQNVHEVRCFDQCFHSMRSSGSDRLSGLRIPESCSDGHNGSSYHPDDGW